MFRWNSYKNGRRYRRQVACHNVLLITRASLSMYVYCHQKLLPKLCCFLIGSSLNLLLASWYLFVLVSADFFGSNGLFPFLVVIFTALQGATASTLNPPTSLCCACWFPCMLSVLEILLQPPVFLLPPFSTWAASLVQYSRWDFSSASYVLPCTSYLCWKHFSGYMPGLHVHFSQMCLSGDSQPFCARMG